MNFEGEYINTVDSKWRVSIPKELRDVLASAGEDGLVLTRNRDGGLSAYPPSEWTVFARKIEQHPNAAQRTAMNRLYIGGKSEVKFDPQGRVPLGKALRKHAGLEEDEREVVLVGNFNRIDIFSQCRYDEVIGQAVDLLDQDPGLIEELDLP